MQTAHVATETECIQLVHMSLESKEDMKTDKLTDFKCDAIDMSSEYCVESVAIAVDFEKVKDTVDFAASVESKLIEVGTDTFGEKHIAFIDTMTSHDEAKVNVEETLTEFVMSELVDCESSFETKYINESCGQEGPKVVQVSSEFRSVIVDCSSEWMVKMTESQLDHAQTTTDKGVETIAIDVVEQSSEYELTSCTVECEMVEQEMIEPVVEQTVESEVERLVDECVSSDMKMVDIGTTIRAQLEDISTLMAIEHVEHSSEWSKDKKYENEMFETQQTVFHTTTLSSDEYVQYCSVDIQCDEVKSIKVDSGCETSCVMIDSQSEFEVNFFTNPNSKLLISLIC